MEKNINILVRNNGMPHSDQGTESKKIVEVPMGATLEEAYQLSGLKMEHGPISARVNNKVEGMHYRIYNQKEVEFLDITSASGIRAYTRTLFFILCICSILSQPIFQNNSEIRVRLSLRLSARHIRQNTRQRSLTGVLQSGFLRSDGRVVLRRKAEDLSSRTPSGR